MSEFVKPNGQYENKKVQIPAILHGQGHGLAGWSQPDIEAIRHNIMTVPVEQRVIHPEYSLYQDLAEGRIPIDVTVFKNGQH